MTSTTLDDEYEEFDELEDDEDDDEQGFSGLLVLLMGLLMFGAMAMVVWVAYQHGVKMGEAREEPPFVSADPSPVKIENAAGAAAGEVDREVYDRFDGAGERGVDVIAEAPEEPLSRSASGQAAGGQTAGAGAALESAARQKIAAAEDLVADRIASLAAEDAAAAARAEEAARTAAARRPDSERPVSERPVSERPVADRPASERPAPAAASRPASERVAAAPTPAPASAASAGGADAMSGTHLVQLAALKSRAEADATWRTLSGKLGSYLDGKAPHVLAPLNADDIYHRLRVGPFASQDAAKTFCEGLKTRGQNCLVKAK